MILVVKILILVPYLAAHVLIMHLRSDILILHLTRRTVQLISQSVHSMITNAFIMSTR